MGIPHDGSRNGGGWNSGGVDLRLLPPEHSFTVYCNQDHYGPVSGGRAEAGVKGDQVVVGSGCIGCGLYADGGSGGRTNRGTGGYGRDGDGDRLSWRDNNVSRATLRTRPNDPLDYVPGSEHHQPIISTLGDTGV